MTYKKSKKIKHFAFCFVILHFTFLFLIFTSVSALPMDSSRFKIDSANVKVGGVNKNLGDYELSDTIGKLEAGQFSSTGHVVKIGFQYLDSVVPLNFNVSDTNINLGILAPGTPAMATTNLTVNFGIEGQYQLTAIEEVPLKTQVGKTIGDTVCDDRDNCSEELAKVWVSNSIYGFGYGMSGNDISGDFIDETYYRPFPDRTSAESPVTIMAGNTGKNRQSTVTFKTNISSIQNAGSYQTVISFVATPSY